MCVICVSEKGVRQPNEKEIRNMWNRNSHGAGYMFYNKECKSVEIHKGFMNIKDFMRAIENEHFTDDDVVVYHFRISTQAGVNPEMTHPFCFTNDLEMTKVLDARTSLGIAHNGIISMTSTHNKDYSDTALFIANYLPLIVKDKSDLQNQNVLDMINELISSKMVFLDDDGTITLVGNFIEEKNGLIFSNSSYQGYDTYKIKSTRSSRFSLDDNYDYYNINSKYNLAAYSI